MPKHICSRDLNFYWNTLQGIGCIILELTLGFPFAMKSLFLETLYIRESPNWFLSRCVRRVYTGTISVSNFVYALLRFKVLEGFHQIILAQFQVVMPNYLWWSILMTGFQNIQSKLSVGHGLEILDLLLFHFTSSKSRTVISTRSGRKDTGNFYKKTRKEIHLVFSAKKPTSVVILSSNYTINFVLNKK